MVSRIVPAWLLASLVLAGGLPGAAAGQGGPPVTTLSDGRAGQIHFESRTPAGYFALARREAGPAVVVVGTLRLPKEGAARGPAMVIAHGSAGVGVREAAWADRLGALGLATFVVDSFTPRNVRETATDQARLPTATNVADAFAALRLLATHPRIDPDRIGIIGFSKGGQVALYTALEPFRRAVLDDDCRFAAHVALYPYCSDWYTAARVTGAPMLLLLGGRDDYTPAEACRGYAEWFRTVGAETTVVTYASAYHDFDSDRAPRFERALVTGRGCDMAVDLDRFTVTRRGSGEDITATASRYARDCLARGATIGGDPEARRRAPEDVASFLRRVLRPETH
jgi:dienelactone hydrolase